MLEQTLSGYSGDVNSKEGIPKLFEHLRATLRPDADSGSISFKSIEGDDSVEIGKEQNRTKGVGNNSVMGNFGKDLQKCIKNKVTSIMKTQLLCTFTKRNKFYETVDIIIACNDIVFDKIYVFQNEKDYHQLICTYNVEYDEDFVENVPDTISLT